MDREFRISHGVEMRAKKDGKGIEGYAAVFDKRSLDLGGFREIIRPGAFARAIKEKQDVRCMFNHDPNMVLGRTSSGTMRMVEDKTGLSYDCDFPDTQTARDVHALVSRGDVSGCSFSFRVPDREKGQRWSDSVDEAGKPIMQREVFDVDMHDLGPVTNPAYPQTSVDARMLWPDGPPVEVRAHLLESRAAKTKKVDGEDLGPGAFAWVGDANDPKTWKLPIKFSTEEKTKSHIRNALARFGQTQGIPADKKAGVWKKIVAAAKKHGIEVSDSDSLRAFPGLSIEEIRKQVAAHDEECQCDCAECQGGDCEDCSNEDCEDDNCDHGDRSVRVSKEDLDRMAMRLRLSKAS